MTRARRVSLGGLLATAFVLVAASSFAADPAPRAAAGATATGREGSRDYGYRFEDDPLSAGGFGPNDARILVRPPAARTTLIRPRTSFVAEMLKSVENI